MGLRDELLREWNESIKLIAKKNNISECAASCLALQGLEILDGVDGTKTIYQELEAKGVIEAIQDYSCQVCKAAS